MKKGKRIYIAGPVSGLQGLNRTAFDTARERLQSLGYTPLIPHWFVPRDTTWKDAMRLSIETLVKCDGVALLDGWQESRGATLERDLAKQLGMEVKTVDEWRAER